MVKPKYIVKPSSRFKKDLKRLNNQKQDLEELYTVISKLANDKKLDAKYLNHKLSGSFQGCYECHIQPNWLLIYEIDESFLYLYLIRTGSHSELFGK